VHLYGGQGRVLTRRVQPFRDLILSPSVNTWTWVSDLFVVQVHAKDG
jgi:hypothetical protein